MLARLLLLFLITPVVELALLIKVGEIVGFWPTIGLILVTGITGSYLARREGLSVWRRLKARLEAGGLPGRELIDGVIILIAGAFLITPGVLTDLVGFLGLLPPTRALIRRYAMKRLERAVRQGTVHVSFGAFGQEGFDAFSERHVEREGRSEWTGTGHDVPRYRKEVGEAGPGREQ